MSIKIGQASLGETGGRGQKPGNQNSQRYRDTKQTA